MSRKGNVLGNRLGISKNWKTHIDVNKYSDTLSSSYFIKDFIINFLQKYKNVWVLNSYIVKNKNILDVYVLYCSPWVKNFFIYDLFYTKRRRGDKYFKPWYLKLMSIPRAPTGYNLKKRYKYKFRFKWIRKKELNKAYQLLQLRRLKARLLAVKFSAMYWRRQIKTTINKIYMEFVLSKILKTCVNIKLYNIIDLMRSNVMSNSFQLVILRSLYFLPKDQKRYGFGIRIYMTYLALGIMIQNSSIIGMVFYKTLKKTRGFIPFLYFWILYIEEFFYRISMDILPDNIFRATHLKIQVSGKIGRNMRAIKRIFNFNDVVARDIPSQTLNKSIDFSLTEVVTRAGVLGFKIWIY